MPFVYEENSSEHRQWIERFFYSKRRVRSTVNRLTGEEEFHEAKPLIEQLVDVGLGLLFYQGFSVPKQPRSTDKVIHSIWETGVGCTAPLTFTNEFQVNKVEVLRFLISLSSDALYQRSNVVYSNGSKVLTYTVSQLDNHLVMTVLCSLLNTTLKYSPGWKVPYDHMLILDRQRQLVTYSLQYLLILLIYSIPKDGHDIDNPLRNCFRHYFSRIHKVQDLQFIADSLTRLLTQPIQVSSSYLPGSKKEIRWTTELMILFWDSIQCNKRFRQYLITSNRAHDFLVIVLYYIYDKRNDQSKQGLIRLCTYILLFLSSDEAFSKSLNKRFEGQSALPENIKLSGFNGTFADYTIVQVLKIINNIGSTSNFLVPTLLDCVYNIAPYVVNVSYLASSNVVQLFSVMASPSFFLASSNNRSMLHTLIKIILLLVSCNFHANRNLMFSMLRNEKVFVTLATYIQSEFKMNSKGMDSDQFVIEDEEVEPETHTKEIKKSKGKEKYVEVNNSSEDRPNMNKKKGEALKQLGEVLILVDELINMITATKGAIMYDAGESGRSSLSEVRTSDERVDPHTTIESIGKITTLAGLDMTPKSPSQEQFIEAKFIWNSNSLGWYESMLWGAIYQSEHQVDATITDAASVIGHNSTTVGVWNGTNILLFKVQEINSSTPSLLRPKGVVDAVAETMIQKVGQLAASQFSSSRQSQ